MKKKKVINIINIVTFVVFIIVSGFLTIYNTFVFCPPLVYAPNEFCVSNTYHLLQNINNFLSELYQIIVIIVIIISILNIVINKKNKKKLIFPIIALLVATITLVANIYTTSNYREDEMITYKPIIYLYPKETIDLNIVLKNSSFITTSYPKYQNSWNIKVDPSGNVYDYKTKRNYYALYWEGIDNSIIDQSEGFIVKKENTTKFLEDKLTYIGLSNREINEFIIYWLPELEENNYNYIRFRQTEEVNKYMPIIIDKNPDTLIRVYMDYKKANKNTKVKEQKLYSTKRNGFTVVEWGGRNIK